METINALSGELGQRLTWTLLDFLWQGAVLAGLLESVIYLCGVRSLTARYRLALAALMLMAACPIVTFRFVRPAPLIVELPQPADERTMPPDLPAAGPPIMLDPRESTAGERVGCVERSQDRAVRSARTSAASRNTPVSSSVLHAPYTLSALARWQPWLLGGWAVGAGLLALRLLIGGGMAWRMRLGRLPLDPEWADRARRLALRLGVRRAAVFVSSRVRQALVAGVWRPMVLLPAAWLAKMPPEMLEGVLAHELAHLRRLDLWAILLQRLVETFLFYHPAVWWLSRRLSREREMCCDEMAVAATGDRLAFTEALQWAVEQPAADSGPVLGAAWKGNQKMVIERIRRLLGADVPRERFSWWPLGLAALVVPALLMFSALSAKEAPPAEKPGDGTPTLAEIAKANDAAWAAIRSVDMEMEMTVSLNVRGKTVREKLLPGLRWSKDGERERVHGRIGDFELATDDVNDIESNIDVDTNWIDQYHDGKKTYLWSFNDNHQDEIACDIHPQKSELPFPAVFLLRNVTNPNIDGLRCSTLANLITSGGVTIRGKQTSKDGDTIWVLEVDEPTPREADAADKKNPTFTRIYVDADKGFLVNRVATRISRTAVASRLPAAEEHDFIEIVKFTDCGHGAFFPSTIKCQSRKRDNRDKPLSDVYQAMTISASRLSVNTALPSDAFAFVFPEHAVVHETVPGVSTRKVMIWGPGNKPVKEFATEKDFDDFQWQEKAKEARRQEAPKYDPKKPADSYPSVAGAYNPPQQSSATAQRPQEEAGAAMSGVGTSSDAGLVGNVTIDPDSIDFAQRKMLEETRKEVQRKLDSKDLADMLARACYYLNTKEFDKALSCYEAVIAADPRSHWAALAAHPGCGMACLMRGRDFAKAAAEFSECLPLYEAKNAAEESKNAYDKDLRMLHFMRGLAYANQADGLDKALADMTTVIESKPGEIACDARLVRSAIYLLRNELDKARSNIAEVLHSANPPADAYGISSLIFAKQGNRARAEQDRLAFAAQLAISQRPSAAREGSLDDMFGVILHRTLLRLLPAMQSLIPVDRAPQLTAEVYRPHAIVPNAESAHISILNSDSTKMPPWTADLDAFARVPRAETPAPATITPSYTAPPASASGSLNAAAANDLQAPAPVLPPDSRTAKPHVDEAQRQKALSVKFVGNQFVSAARLKRLIDTQSPDSNRLSGEFDRKKLDEDVSKLTAYYRGFGFFHARIGREVEFNEKQNCDTVTFVIDEGPRYSVGNVSFLGNRKFDNARLAAKLKLLSDQPFDQNQQTLDLQQLRDEYCSEGYVFAKVEADNRFLEELGRLDIVYNIEEGARYRISRLKIENKGENPPTIYGTAPAANPAPTASVPPSAAAEAMVEVYVAVLAVDRAKLRLLGFDLDKALASLDAEKSDAILMTWRHDGLAELVSCPQVATVSGHKASVRVGGMSLDVLPTVVDKEHVRVECHWRLSREEGINPPAAGSGKKPVTQTLQFDSTPEMRFGRTMVVSGGRLQGANGEKEIIVLVKAKLFDGKVAAKQARDIPVSVAARNYLKLTAVDEAGKPIADASIKAVRRDDKATLIIAQSIYFYAPVRITAASGVKVSASKDPVSFPLPELKSLADRGEAPHAMTAMRGTGELASDAGRRSLRVVVVDKLGQGIPGARIKVVYGNGEDALTADTITLDGCGEMQVNGFRTVTLPKANEQSTKAPAAKPAEKDKPFVQGFDKDDSRR